jgi:hypothetical protein
MIPYTPVVYILLCNQVLYAFVLFVHDFVLNKEQATRMADHRTPLPNRMASLSPIIIDREVAMGRSGHKGRRRVDNWRVVPSRRVDGRGE